MPDLLKPDAKSDVVRVKVARGRSIQHGSFVVTDKEKNTGRLIEKMYTAGQELDMSAAEAAELKSLGFIEDPDAEPPPLPQGARVGLVSSERR